jgi:hypothetical protein
MILEMLQATAPRIGKQDPASRMAGHTHRQTKGGQRGEEGRKWAGLQALSDGNLFKSGWEKQVG